MTRPQREDDLPHTFRLIDKRAVNRGVILSMNQLLARCWWMLALLGVISLVFAFLALAWPGLTLLSLVVLFAAYALLAGVTWISGATRHRKTHKDWWLFLILGLVSIGAGVTAVLNPGLTTLALVFLMGAYALLMGVLEIVVAVRLRKAIRGEWLMILTGVVSAGFGILVFLFPGAGALALVWLISFYAALTGALLLTLAFRARRWQEEVIENNPRHSA
jgi:uncharacterized membrane protein HdeD (DUF308 family)